MIRFRSAHAVLALLLAACTDANSPEGGRSANAEKWYQRALGEFRSADIDAARDSAQHALDLVPADEEVRLLAARVALARLELDEALRLLKGIGSSEASGLRGRAHWYKGDLERAADELEQLLADPEVRDPWAKSISSLARRGEGRKPFETRGALLANVEMPPAPREVPFVVVPVEIDGDPALAMVSTGSAEVVLDGATRNEPSWVSLRFEGRLEIKDVPALTRDLTDVSQQLGAPIKALLGANLLRHLNATVDRRGRQVVLRTFSPPPPPVASRIDVFYLRGGGMVLGGGLFPADPGAASGEGRRASLFVDSNMSYPLALDRDGWKKAGLDVASLNPLLQNGHHGPELRAGAVPLLQFGAFKLPQLEAVYGVPIDSVERELDIDIDGAVGAGLLADYRLTFAEGGRVLWAEQSVPIAAGSLPSLPPSEQLPLPGQPGTLLPLAPGGVLPLTPSLPDPQRPEVPR